MILHKAVGAILDVIFTFKLSWDIGKENFNGYEVFAVVKHGMCKGNKLLIWSALSFELDTGYSNRLLRSGNDNYISLGCATICLHGLVLQNCDLFALISAFV